VRRRAPRDPGQHSHNPLVRYFSVLGPGLVTGASDDDPSGIATYSQVGSQFGFGLLWTMLFSYPLMGGTLTTGGGLVFTGNQDGYAMAFDDTTGELLWRFQTGAGVRGQPATYKIGGRQYVAVPSGGGGLAVSLAGENPLASKGSALVVFALAK